MVDQFIFKVTGKCNLACQYCYYLNNHHDAWNVNFDPNNFDTLFRNYKAYNDRLKIVWHGGEPLLVGIEFYKKALAAAKAHGITLQNSIQTNGVLLDDAWCDFFAEHDFTVGLSLDGPKEIHDRHRVMRNNGSSYDAAINAISLLQKRKMKYGVLAVISPTESGLEVFNHFLELGIDNMDFILPIITREGEEEEQNILECANYLSEVLNEWIRLDDPNIKIRFLKNIIFALIGQKPMHCVLRNSCNKYITIEPNGDVGLCEKTKVINMDFYKTGLNVVTHDFHTIEKAVKEKLSGCSFNKISKECLDCTLVNICNNGCPVSRYEQDKFGNKSIYCNLYKSLIHEIKEFVARCS